MEKHYFIASKNSRLGPFTLSQLKEQDIDSNTLIWCEGMEQWTKAGEFDELKSTIPPPTPFQIESQTKRKNYEKLFHARKRILVKAAKKTAVIFCIIFLLLFVMFGGLRDNWDAVDMLFEMKVYTTTETVKSTIAAISLFWSSIISIICFVCFYMSNSKK